MAVLCRVYDLEGTEMESEQKGRNWSVLRVHFILSIRRVLVCTFNPIVNAPG